jgi:hypothetical protein
LQDYNKAKKLETMYLRKRFKKKNPNCFSCVEPHTYGDRFYEFLAKNLFTEVREYPEEELLEITPSTKEGGGGSGGRNGKEDEGSPVRKPDSKEKKGCTIV